jgi:ankyrin repeat protein
MQPINYACIPPKSSIQSRDEYLNDIRREAEQKSLEWRLMAEELSKDDHSSMALPPDVIANELTPLHIAIAMNLDQLAIDMLHMNASLTELNKTGLSPLPHAAQKCRWDIVNMIIEKRSLEECTPQQLGYALIYVLAHKQFDIARAYLDKQVDMNVNCMLAFKSRSMLHVAIEGPDDIYEKLITLGAAINVQDCNGETPLHLAIAGHKHSIIDILAKNGATMYVKNKSNFTPIDLCAMRLCSECIGPLLTYAWEGDKDDKANFGRLLHQLVSKDTMHDVARHLLNKLPNVNTNWQCVAKKRTTLYEAIATNASIELINKLTSRRTNINSTTHKGKTPLHLAVNRNLDFIVEMLIERGADLNAQNCHGNTPMHCAVLKQCHTIVQLLAMNGADLTRKNKKDLTPVQAVDAYESLQPLMEYAQTQDKADKALFGQVLLTKCKQGQFDVALEILEKIPFVTRTWGLSKSKRTALHLAIANDAPALLIDRLLAHNVLIDQQDSDGKTPLHLAIGKQSENIVAMLIKAHANIFIADKDGLTPLMQACKLPRSNCLNIMLEGIKPAASHNKPMGLALNWSLANGMIQSARAILNSWTFSKGFINLIGKNDTGARLLHLAVTARAPLRIFHMLLTQGADPQIKDKGGNTPLKMASELNLTFISDILEDPKRYLSYVRALGEMYTLHRLGHWLIASLPLEILHLIAQHSGHDDMTIGTIMNFAHKRSIKTLQKLSEIQKNPTRNDTLLKQLEEEYSSIPAGVESIISLLGVLRDDPQTFMDYWHRQKRQARIQRLYHLLMFRNSSLKPWE